MYKLLFYIWCTKNMLKANDSIYWSLSFIVRCHVWFILARLQSCSKLIIIYVSPNHSGSFKSATNATLTRSSNRIHENRILLWVSYINSLTSKYSTPVTANRSSRGRNFGGFLWCSKRWSASLLSIYQACTIVTGIIDWCSTIENSLLRFTTNQPSWRKRSGNQRLAFYQR